jgi:hypothetical protein
MGYPPLNNSQAWLVFRVDITLGKKAPLFYNQHGHHSDRRNRISQKTESNEFFQSDKMKNDVMYKVKQNSIE